MRSLRKLVEGNLGKIINPTLNNSYTLNKIKNDYVVKKTVRIFKNKDFLVNKIDTNRFKIVFNNKLGFEKPDYSRNFIMIGQTGYGMLVLEAFRYSH